MQITAIICGSIAIICIIITTIFIYCSRNKIQENIELEKNLKKTIQNLTQQKKYIIGYNKIARNRI